MAGPDLEVRWGPALKHFVFALSQFWCFMVFWWLWSKNKGGPSPGSATEDHLYLPGAKLFLRYI